LKIAESSEKGKVTPKHGGTGKTPKSKREIPKRETPKSGEKVGPASRLRHHRSVLDARVCAVQTKKLVAVRLQPVNERYTARAGLQASTRNRSHFCRIIY
jgi:hypothetical protein